VPAAQRVAYTQRNPACRIPTRKAFPHGARGSRQDQEGDSKRSDRHLWKLVLGPDRDRLHRAQSPARGCEARSDGSSATQRIPTTPVDRRLPSCAWTRRREAAGHHRELRLPSVVLAKTTSNIRPIIGCDESHGGTGSPGAMSSSSKVRLATSIPTSPSSLSIRTPEDAFLDGRAPGPGGCSRAKEIHTEAAIQAFISEETMKFPLRWNRSSSTPHC